MGPLATTLSKACSRFLSTSFVSILASDDGPAGGCLVVRGGFTWANSSIAGAIGGFFI